MNYKQYIASAGKRNAEVIKLRGKGWTMQRIADKLDVTKQRISQIIARENERKTR